MLQTSSAFETLWWTIYFLNSVGKDKLSCYTPQRRSSTVFLKDLPYLNHQGLLGNSSNLALEVALASEKVAI